MYDRFSFLYESFSKELQDYLFCDSCTLQTQQGCKRETGEKEIDEIVSFKRAHLDQSLSEEVPSSAGLVSWASMGSLSYEICFMQLAHKKDWCLFISEKAKVKFTQ